MTGALPILAPMAVFTLVIAMLAGTVLLARAQLSQREPAAIAVNGRINVDAVTGDTLLQSLHAAGIQIPASCGGRGACGQCRVTLCSEARALLPTEANHISRAAAAAGVRLACMLKVGGDMSIQLPEGVLSAQQHTCRVVSNDNVSTYLKWLQLALPEGSQLPFRAGDYVQVHAPAGEIAYANFVINPPFTDAWSNPQLRGLRANIQAPTRRAYSLASPPQRSGVLQLVVRLALPPPGADTDVPPGMVSSYLFSLRPGDDVEVSGPYGQFHTQQGDREMVFIGGGAGIAPIRAMILEQLQYAQTTRRMSFWYGSRNLHELCFAEEFASLDAAHDNFSFHIALSGPDIEAQWQGETGFIHNVLFDRYLNNHPCPDEAEYYLCGPPLMSSATLAMLEDLGVERSSVYFDDFGST